MVGLVLGAIMQRRYIAAIDIARELGVHPRTVERWLAGELLPSPDDVATLVRLLGDEDGERLRRSLP